MDETLNESLKNIFLKYLDTALNRTKDKFMTQQDKREQTFNRLTDREILIVYLKVFKELTFVQIGKYMGESWQRIASSYTYARKKIEKRD